MEHITSVEENIAYLRRQVEIYRDKADKVKDKLSIEHYSFMKMADSFERDLKQEEKKAVKPKQLTRKERSHARNMSIDYEKRAANIEDKTSEEYIQAKKLAEYFENELEKDDQTRATAKTPVKEQLEGVEYREDPELMRRKPPVVRWHI